MFFEITCFTHQLLYVQHSIQSLGTLLTNIVLTETGTNGVTPCSIDNDNDNDFIHFLDMRHRKYSVIQRYIYSMCMIRQCWLNT